LKRKFWNDLEQSRLELSGKALIVAHKSAPGFSCVVLYRGVEISFMPMHVHDQPAEIQSLTLSHHETTETRSVALRIDARTDCGRAAADVDLLDDEPSSKTSAASTPTR